MSNQVATTPYSFTSPMANSFLNTVGAVPSTGPISLETVRWVSPAANAELTITDGYGKTLLHMVASGQDVANGVMSANLSLVTKDFQVVSITSGTVYVSTSATNTATGVAGGSVTTHGTAVGAGTAQAQTVLSIAEVTPTSVVAWSFEGPIVATWETGIQVLPVCGNGTVTIYLVNGTAASITPAAATINVRVIN